MIAEPNDASSDDHEAPETCWELCVGQGRPRDQVCAWQIPAKLWRAALKKANGRRRNGYVILQAPGGSYVQTMAEPVGYVLEYRECWPRKAALGYRHYRAYRPRKDGQQPSDDDPHGQWAMPLKAVSACFSSFSKHPDKMPEAARLGWQDVTSVLMDESISPRTVLKRLGDHFRWKHDAWPDVLELAEEFGWEPAGTKSPRGIRKADWDAMNYVSQQRQTVTAEDAAAMAEALSKALAKISDNPKKRVPKGACRGIKEFWGWSREGLQDFAAYCQRGPFRVTDDPYEQ